jgi:hypothetical protein
LVAALPRCVHLCPNKKIFWLRLCHAVYETWGIERRDEKMAMKIGLALASIFVLLLAQGKTMVFAQSFPSMPPQHYPSTPTSPGPPAYTPLPPGTLPAPVQPAPPTGEKERGVVNPRTGEFYPGTHGGVIDPKTGVVLPKVEGGYQNPQTGETIPQNRSNP